MHCWRKIGGNALGYLNIVLKFEHSLQLESLYSDDGPGDGST
jgi:hypothetical protein